MLKIIQNRRIPFTASIILFFVSLGCVVVFGLKLGIDFTGGSLIEVNFSESRPELQEVRNAVEPLDFGEVTVQPSGDDGYIFKLRFVSEEEHQQLLGALRENFETSSESGETVETEEEISEEGAPAETEAPQNKVYEKRIETIGSSISAHLRNKAWYTAIAVIIAIIIYVAYAFRKVSKPVKSWKFGITAIIALVHDVTIVMGIFAVLGHFYGVEVNIPFVVALLTILGYSVNDTIVVFDRIRENLIKYGYDRFEKTVNNGVNETLVRSLNTSITTLLVLLAIFLFGGETIKYFALALIIGIISGTYSSIFLASPLLVVWERVSNRKR